MYRTIKHKELIEFLTNIGFRQVRTTGAHLVFSYPQRHAIIALRQMKSNEIVPHFVFASVRRTILEKGIATEKKIEIELKKIKK